MTWDGWDDRSGSIRGKGDGKGWLFRFVVFVELRIGKERLAGASIWLLPIEREK